MRVMLTRPAGLNEALAARLEAQGIEVALHPLIAIQGLALGQEAKRLLGDLGDFCAAVFVSRSAVRYGLEAIGRFSKGLPEGMAVYGVGPGTAAALGEQGIHAEAPATPGSEALLEAPGLQAVQGKAILIVKGRGGREILQARLAERGARVACLECYERLACPLDADGLPPAEGKREVVALTSGEILESFLASGGLAPSRFTAVAPSARVAALAARHGFKKVVDAGAASDDALYDCLMHLHQQADG